jgi:hypothetical protein
MTICRFMICMIFCPLLLSAQGLMKNIRAEQSGLRMADKIKISDDSFKEYMYYGNSSGVGVADFNNDGLTDIFFSANKTGFKLYLNKGNFQFNDVSVSAGVTGNGNWGTGVSIADINGDGLADIYVSHSGNYSEADSLKLSNELFINQGIDKTGVPHFKEMATSYGLDLPGSQTTQACFFDYDRDGDLDVFILNHAKNPYIVLNDVSYFHKDAIKNYSNRLLRNDNGHFIDVSAQAGIIGSSINFGLGITVCDMNNDGWPDIYSTSDFEERDNYYINQRNGTFKESLALSMNHISQFSMGIDVADINNDGLMDLVTVDMKPASSYRQKVIATQDNDDKFRNMMKMGFFAQYARNVLQLNQGIDEKGIPHFSEIGQLAGISATDWSWSPLLVDFDNDGQKDLFISCGFAYFDNLDISNKFVGAKIALTDQPLKLNSQFFKNKDGKSFSDVTARWKDNTERMSYAAAYADFDNDGKVDLVVSNLNEDPTLYKNTGAGSNYVSIKLKGKGMNSFAIGARVEVRTGTTTQVQELQPVRGYQSSQDPVLHFGLDKQAKADIIVTWPDGTVTELKEHACNRLVELDQKNASAKMIAGRQAGSLYKEISLPEAASFISKQNDHPDFKYQFTLPYKVSDPGQVVAEGDINGDGLMDYYIGGEAGTEKFFMMGGPDGLFKKQAAPWVELSDENRSAKITDIDKDGKPDLIVVSRKGSAAQPQQYDKDNAFICRVFQNKGNGDFTEIQNAFPGGSLPMQVIATGDIDHDGDDDLFLGGFASPLFFGRPTPSFVFRNDSKPGSFAFANITLSVLPSPILGMITSAEWKDMDHDNYPELFLAGEWMNCRLFKNNKGQLSDISQASGLSEDKGLWSFISPVDVNGDGHIDIIAGNAGLNNTFNAGKTHPMKLSMVRFADVASRSVPLVSCFYGDNKDYPVYYRDELLAAVQPLRKSFVVYETYARSTISDIYNVPGTKVDTVLSCNILASGVYVNDGNNKFSFHPFPAEAQVSRMNTTGYTKNNELVTAGNFFGYRTQFGMADAMPLVSMTGDGKSFTASYPDKTGLFSTGQVSKLFFYTFNHKERILVFRKNESPQIFERNEP